MIGHIPEADWKAFKELRDLALERFSRQVRIDCISKFNDSSLSEHERYLAVYELIQERDREILRMFDSLRRSTALFQLKSFWAHRLLDEQDVQVLSEETRQLAGMLDSS